MLGYKHIQARLIAVCRRNATHLISKLLVGTVWLALASLLVNGIMSLIGGEVKELCRSPIICENRHGSSTLIVRTMCCFQSLF